MSTVIEKFLTERGVLAAPPDRPLESYAKYWERTVRWLAAGEKAEALVRTHGAAAARDMLNLAIGQPAFFTDDRYVPQHRRQGSYGFILLPGGCEWALKKEYGGQCAFCEFQEIVDFVAGDLPFSHEEFMAIFRAGFATMSDADMLNVFTAGSFLNPGEIPMESQAAMARAVAAAGRTSILRVESRVQFMVEETIRPLVEILAPNGKTLDVAIGFETQDEWLRNKTLRKGMSRGGFIRGVQTAKALGARVSAYVILMPIGMEEGYAIKECVDSIKFAFETGVDEVLLQARYSHYPEVKCPKLWSIAQVLRETASLGPVMLGKWETELPEPKVWPQNCPACTPQVMQALVRWRDGLQPTELAEDRLPECACHKDWEVEAAKMDPPPERPRLPVIPGE